MVNETNKPQDSLENEELGQRLAASNQALADMQAEHRQLLQEMEQLRRRAEDLQRLREQQEREEQERKRQYQESVAAAAAAAEAAKLKEETENNNQTEETPKEATSEEGEDPEEAEYIKEKLAEIARLKAQLKRVQHMVNTTELIENHISKHEGKEKTKTKESPAQTKPAAKPAAVVATAASSSSSTTNPIIPPTLIPPVVASTPIELLTMPDMPTMADLAAATTSDEKEQLISTMLNMFQDFSSDLRSQADNLRAERARIKELKESIIKSRKEPPPQ